MEKNLSFELSIDTIKEIPFDRYLKDFTFIVNGREYKTSRFYADFLSPLIRRYHMIDETISSFTINTSYTYQEIDFSTVLSLDSFSPIELNSEKVNFLREIFLKLDNKKEYLKLMPSEFEELTLDNVFEQINEKRKYFKNVNNNENIDIKFFRKRN